MAGRGVEGRLESPNDLGVGLVVVVVVFVVVWNLLMLPFKNKRMFCTLTAFLTNI